MRGRREGEKEPQGEGDLEGEEQLEGHDQNQSDKAYPDMSSYLSKLLLIAALRQAHKGLLGQPVDIATPQVVHLTR